MANLSPSLLATRREFSVLVRLKSNTCWCFVMYGGMQKLQWGNNSLHAHTMLL